MGDRTIEYAPERVPGVPQEGYKGGVQIFSSLLLSIDMIPMRVQVKQIIEYALTLFQ